MSTALRWRRPKPDGGFCLIPATSILTVWFAFHGAIIELVDLRVWLACFELLARRCGAESGKPLRYRLVELEELTGASRRSVRSAVGRLEAVGLLNWSDTKIRPCAEPADLPGDMQSNLAATLSFVGNAERLVPIPRRGLRDLVRSRRRVLIATTLGHLLRGMYFKQSQCVSGGRCKASWIARVFGVDARNVKAARRTLVDSGWLLTRDSSQTAMNRWGAAFVVNLEHGSGSKRPARESPPPAATIGTETPPPERNRKLLEGSKNQNPAERRPIGAQVEKPRTEIPALKKLIPGDLSDPSRLLRLHAQAATEGRITRSENDRLKFFAAAEHARAVGTKNPCGLFAAIVNRGLWSYITQAAEDRARQKLTRLREQIEFHEVRAFASDETTAVDDGRFRGENTAQDDEEVTSIRIAIRRSLGLSADPACSFDFARIESAPTEVAFAATR